MAAGPLCWPIAGRTARRKLFDLVGSSPIARQGLTQIAKLYEIEAGILGKPANERLAVRQSRSTPIVTAFGT